MGIFRQPIGSDDRSHTQGTDTALGALGTKATPVDADKVIQRDSADSDALVTSTWAQVKAFLKSYFDSLYSALTHASSHVDGTDDIRAATNALKGLATAAHITAVESNTSLSHTQGTDTAMGVLGAKGTPVDADKVIHRDSESADALVTSTWGEVKTFMKSYFDALYVGWDAQIQGVKWDETADAYTRTGALAVYAVSASPGSSALPFHSQMRRCVVNDSGVVQYYLDPTDSTLKADGVTSSVLDGTDGQVMVEIPKFYYRYSYLSGVHHWEIANSAGCGFELHPAFVKNGVEMDARYVGAYEGYIDTGVLGSVSGQTPTTSQTRAQFRTAAEARGAGWHQWDATLHHLVSLLYLIEYADLNSQAMIGDGNTAYTSWPGSPPSLTGVSNSAGDATWNQTTAGGSATDGMSYRGIENLYGHVWKFMDGLNVHNSTAHGSQVWLSQNPDDYADDTDVGYRLAGLAAETDGYGATLIADSGLFYPASVGADSLSKMGDYHYTYFDNDPDVAWRVVRAGGGAYSGALAGAFCVSSTNGSSLSLTYIGGRLCF